jgi:hypothetical protein
MAAFQPFLPMQPDNTNQTQPVERPYDHALVSRETGCDSFDADALMLLHGFAECTRLQLECSEPKLPKRRGIAGCEGADLDVRRHA